MYGLISGNIRKAFFSENIRNFLILELESSISGNIRDFLGDNFFLFFLGLGWEVRGYISGSIRNFLMVESESSISRNIKNFFRGELFCFFWARAGKWAR